MTTILTEFVPMRDGIALFTSIHLPGGEGPFHVVLLRNPYCAKDSVPREAPAWLPPGTAFVLQSCRGTGASQGRFYPWINETRDGEDCLRWVASQPWCDGRIAMAGGSYCGAAQWFAAKSGIPQLLSICPAEAPCNYRDSPKYIGGAFILQQNIAWAMGNWLRNNPQPGAPKLDPDTLSRHLPLKTIDQAAGLGTLDFWQDWIAHPAYDAYWEALDLNTFADRIRCPAFIASGWFDIYTQGALDSFVLMRARAATPTARAFTRCVIGPWAHGEDMGGEMDRGTDFSMQKHAADLEARFTSALLANPGVDPLPGEPPLRYFMLGCNEWCTAESWPPPESRPTSFFLDSRGAANTRHGDGTLSTTPPSANAPADAFIYDPRNPVPTTGGHGICVPNGCHDQSAVELRADVLVYDSEILAKDIDIAGRVTVTLFASSSAVDTDFTAKLVDVYPDGRALNLADGIRRARYRESDRMEKFLTPFEPTKIEIDLWSIANCFRKGHRIRLEVSSSNFPEFDRNPNTGHKFGEDDELRIAKQVVYHNPDHPSSLVLPVLAG